MEATKELDTINDIRTARTRQQEKTIAPPAEQELSEEEAILQEFDAWRHESRAPTNSRDIEASNDVEQETDIERADPGKEESISRESYSQDDMQPEFC